MLSILPALSKQGGGEEGIISICIYGNFVV